MPAIGVKMVAVPGRLNETWFRAEKNRNILRAMFGALRHPPRLYADSRRGGGARRFCKLGGQGASRIRPI
jgi:hypothetical protein